MKLKDLKAAMSTIQRLRSDVEGWTLPDGNENAADERMNIERALDEAEKALADLADELDLEN